MMTNIYDAMPPVRIGALIACRLRSIEMLCANALNHPAHDFTNLGELPQTRYAAVPAKVGGVGAIGGGVLRAHVPNLDVEPQHVVLQEHGQNADGR